MYEFAHNLLLDTALTRIKERFSQMELFFELYGFLYTVDEMKKAIKIHTLEQKCENLSHKMKDMDSIELGFEINIVVKALPSTCNSCFGILSYLYRDTA